MRSLIDYILCLVLKGLAVFFRFIPFTWAMAIGLALGRLGYFIFPKKTRTVYLNLKTVFGQERSHAELKVMTRQVFENIVCGFIELLCIPKFKKENFDHYVTVSGEHHVQQALSKGQGVILAAVHSGSWELASMIGSLHGFTYHIVANRQLKTPKLDLLLQEYRRSGGARVIIPGESTKDILRAIKKNEILSIVIDQGGREGVVIPFLGKTASMSTGAIRLALKYGCTICPVWMSRKPDGGHLLTAFAPIDVVSTGDEEKDVKVNLLRTCEVLEPLIKANPTEYLWFYKVFKYSDHLLTVILDDGKKGHLRQSQAIASVLEEVAVTKNKKVEAKEVVIAYKGGWGRYILNALALLSCVFPFLRGRWMLDLTLDAKSMALLDQIKPDIVVSTGSGNSAVAVIYGLMHRAKMVGVLKQGLMPLSFFDRVVLPVHDGQNKGVETIAAPNLITKNYLKLNSALLLNRYSHLKSDVRLKIGVLIGGDTKGVVTKIDVIRQLITHLKNACEHYNAIVLITTSRRTPVAVDQYIAREMESFKRCGLCIIANQQPIDEAVGGILGLSDVVLVSGESISMVSEAASAGKVTIVFSLTGEFAQQPTNKYERFVHYLQAQGYVVAPSIKELPTSMAMLLGRKVTLKQLDDRPTLVRGLQGIV